MELIGLIANSLLIICAIPQVVKTIRTGEASSYSVWFLFTYLIGVVLNFVYTIHLDAYVIAANMAWGFVSVGIITWYKLKPREEKQ
jgi:uncharacterized protein with PQ loop repeat